MRQRSEILVQSHYPLPDVTVNLVTHSVIQYVFFAGIIILDKNGPCLRESVVYERTDGEKAVSGVNSVKGLFPRCENGGRALRTPVAWRPRRTGESPAGVSGEAGGALHTGPPGLTFHGSCVLFLG